MNGENDRIFKTFVFVLGIRGEACVKRLAEAVLRTDDSPDGNSIVFKPCDRPFIEELALECGTSANKLLEVLVEYCIPAMIKHVKATPIEEIWAECEEMERERKRLRTTRAIPWRRRSAQ